MSGKRRSFTSEQKATILRRHLAHKVPAADLEANRTTVIREKEPQAQDQHAARARETNRTADLRERKLQLQVDNLKQRLRRKEEIIAEISEEFVKLKKRTWGALNGRTAPPDLRDEVVDFVDQWSEKTELPIRRWLAWLAVSPAKFYNWKQRYGQGYESKGRVSRDFWLEDWRPSWTSKAKSRWRVTTD